MITARPQELVLAGGTVVIILAAMIYWWITGNPVPAPLNEGLPPKASQQAAISVPPALPLPENGTETRYFSGDAAVPLTVETPDGDNNYFLKVVDANDPHKTVLTFFVRAGMSYQTMLPIGSYRIKYAIGSTWYGPDYLFGPGTLFDVVADNLDFTEDATGYNGHKLTLKPVANGNLIPQPLQPQDW